MRNQKRLTAQMFGLMVALLVLTGWFALPDRLRANPNPDQASASGAKPEDNEDNNEPFVGIWDVTVSGIATYYYTYSISAGAFVATGNIDRNWDGAGSSFGPTMGTYVRTAPRSYRIREKGWSFDPQGNPAGHFEFVGTYTVDKKGKTLTGAGTYKLFDLNGNATYVEPLTVTGTKLFP